MASEPNLFNLTQVVVMAHPNLITARPFKKNGKEVGDPKFGAQFVFKPDSEDLKAMKSLAIQVAKARWPGRDIAKDIKENNFSFPFNDGNKIAEKRKNKSGKDDADYARGNVVIAARSKYRPNLAILEGGRLVDLTEEAAIVANKGKFYFGVEVLAQFNFQPFEGGTGPDGVCAYLNMVVSTNTGKKIAGGSGQSASQVFKGYVGGASAEDPTGGETEDSDDPNAGLEGLI